MIQSGSSHFSVEYAASVLTDDVPKLPQNIRKTIKRAIETRLMIDPIQFGKPLRYSLSGLRSLRVGDYRVIYTLNMEQHLVSILSIAHRRKVYEDL